MSEPNAVTRFDPATLADRLKDRLRLEILEMMTPEERVLLIRSAITSFTAPPPRQSNWDQPRPSQLENMVHGILSEELRVFARSQITSWLDGGEIEPGVSVAAWVRTLVKAKTQDLLEGILSQAVGQGLQGLYGNLGGAISQLSATLDNLNGKIFGRD